MREIYIYINKNQRKLVIVVGLVATDFLDIQPTSEPIVIGFKQLYSQSTEITFEADQILLVQFEPVRFSWDRVSLDTPTFSYSFSFYSPKLLATRLNTRLDRTSLSLRLRFFFFLEKCIFVGPVYYSRDSQISFFSKIFIKEGFYGIIHTFKNYFVTLFLVISF